MAERCSICGDTINCEESVFLICSPCASKLPIENNILEQLTALTAHRDSLAEKICMVLRPRLKEAEGLLEKSLIPVANMVKFTDAPDTYYAKLFREIAVFLSPAPEPEAEEEIASCPYCGGKECVEQGHHKVFVEEKP